MSSIPGAGAPSGLERGTEAVRLRELMMLSGPIAVALYGETFLGLAQNRLVGGLGAAALGGVALGVEMMFLNFQVVFGFMRGVKVRTAFAVGAGRPEDGLRYALVGMGMGAVAGGLILWFGQDISWVLQALAVDPELIAPARDFFAALSLGAPATCTLGALIQHRQALGDARSPMLIGLVGNLLNVLLAYCLINGHAGLPALGISGAGYSTTLIKYLELAVMSWLFLRSARAQRRSSRSKLPWRSAFREVADIGVPIGLHFGFETLAFTCFTAILAGIGSEQIAAHQIAGATLRISFLTGIAIAEAASVFVGRALGQHQLAEADRVVTTALRMGISFMGLCGLVFALFGGGIAAAFTDDPTVAAMAQRLLWLSASFQVFDAMSHVLRGALRGAKDVRMPAILGVVVVWLCVPTAAWFLGRVAGWGALGAWCGFFVRTFLLAVLFQYQWKKGHWRSAYRSAS